MKCQHNFATCVGIVLSFLCSLVVHGSINNYDDRRICFPRGVGEIPPRLGQITDETSFGKSLRDIINLNKLQHILEIGTWFGGGSTRVIADALNTTADCLIFESHKCCQSYLVTFEVFEPAWEYSSRYLQHDPVWLVLGTTVGVQDMLTNDEIPYQDEHYRLYYERDKQIMASQQPKLKEFCENYPFDLALIDGNEYTGWGEFVILRDVCKPRYIALHDTGTLKTFKIEHFLKMNPSFAKLISSGKDGASWSIFEINHHDSISQMETSEISNDGNFINEDANKTVEEVLLSESISYDQFSLFLSKVLSVFPASPSMHQVSQDFIEQFTSLSVHSNEVGDGDTDRHVEGRRDVSEFRFPNISFPVSSVGVYDQYSFVNGINCTSELGPFDLSALILFSSRIKPNLSPSSYTSASSRRHRFIEIGSPTSCTSFIAAYFSCAVIWSHTLLDINTDDISPKELSDRIIHVRGDMQESISVHANDSIDLAFISAQSLSYAELTGYLSMLRHRMHRGRGGGVVLVTQCLEDSDVKRAVEDFVAAGAGEEQGSIAWEVLPYTQSLGKIEFF